MSNGCQNCGAPEKHTVDVWEDFEDYNKGRDPDYIGCNSCCTMLPADEWQDGETDNTPAHE